MSDGVAGFQRTRHGGGGEGRASRGLGWGLRAPYGVGVPGSGPRSCPPHSHWSRDPLPFPAPRQNLGRWSRGGGRGPRLALLRPPSSFIISLALLANCGEILVVIVAIELTGGLRLPQV